MSDISNFLFAWVIYFVAGVIFYGIFWKITKFRTRWFVSYSLRAVTLAVIATPWYVNDQGNLLAPALIIVIMDAITIGGAAAVRAFVPLLLSIMLSFVAVLVAFVIKKGANRKSKDSLQSPR